MGLSEAIEAARSRLTFLRRVTASLVFLIAFSFAGILIISADFLSPKLAWLVAIVSAGAIIFWLLRKGKLRPATNMEAAALLDESLGTKDRVLSYQQLVYEELENPDGEKVVETQSKRALIEEQAASFVEYLNPRTQFKFEPSPWLKRFYYTLPFVWTLLIYLYLKLPEIRFTAPAAVAVAKLVDEHPELPPSVQEALKDLAKELERENGGDDDAAVDDALSRAKEEISMAERELKREKDAKNGKSKDVEQNSSQSGGRSSSPKPTPTPTPKPAPSSDQQQSEQNQGAQASSGESGESQSDQESQQGKGGPAHEKPKEGESASGAKQGGGSQGSNTSGDQGEQQSQGAQQQQGSGGGNSQQQQGSSQGDGGSSQGKGQQGSSQGAQSSGSQGSSGQQGKQGSKGSQGQTPDQDGSDGQQGEGGKKENSQGKQSGDSGAAQGLDAAQKQIQKIEQERKGASQPQQQQQQQGSSQAKQQGQGQGGGKSSGKQQSSGKGGAGESNQEQQSSSQGQQSSGQSPGDGSKGGGAKPKSGDQKSQQSAPPAGDADQSGEAGEAMGKPGSEAKRFEEGEGKWPGLGDQKQFKDTEIEAKENTFDSRFTGKDSTIEKNNGVARPKTGLPDIAVARPDTVKEGADQPIPLEYKDLLQ